MGKGDLLNIIDRINSDIFHERNLNEIFEEKLNQYGFFDIHRNYYQTKYIVNKTSFYKVTLTKVRFNGDKRLVTIICRIILSV